MSRPTFGGIILVKECCQCRLAQTDPAVVRGNQLIGPNLKRHPVKKIFQIFEQQFILKYPA
jgi:hypothetical protein